MQTWNLESNDFGTEASGKTNLEHWETFKQTTVNFFGKQFHALIPSHPSLDIQAGGGDRVVNLPRLSHVHKRPWLGLDKTGRSLCAVKARQRVASVQLRVFFARAA
jgi:hypothetical protein